MDTIKTSFKIPQLAGNKIKPTDERFGLWLLLENLCNNNLITDVGNIDYTNGAEKLGGNGLSHPITEPFCDNIMVVKICDLSDCEKTQLVLKKEVCGSFNSYLRGKFSNFVSARHGVKAKLPFLLSSDNKIAKGLSSIIKKEDWGLIREKYPTPVVTPYKIELADVKLDTLLDKIKLILGELENELYYLVDLDITQDFGGIFSKPEIIKFLTENHDFRYDDESGKSIRIDNNKTVGNDCLTWFTSNARVKIYNKFVCQMTSPGVNKMIGNHIIDFLHCPDERLKGTFYSTLAREHGITRLEATIYNYSLRANDNNNSKLHPVTDCQSVLEKSKSYFSGAPFYSVPIADMWKKLTETLQNSCCLVFRNLLQYVYWGNGNTRKLTGLQFKLTEEKVKREQLIKYALSAYSLNSLPINYLEITPVDGDQNEINISLKCYIKRGSTYFTKTSRPFSTIPNEISISDRGLVDTPNILPQVLRKRANAGSKRDPFPLEEIQPLREPFVTSGRKRQLELEDIETKKRKLDYTQTTTPIQEEYKDKLDKEEQIRKDKEELIFYFKKQWKGLACNDIYELSAFAVGKKDSFEFAAVLVKNIRMQTVYFLKGLAKTDILNKSKNSSELKKLGLVTLTHSTQRGNDLTIFYIPSKIPFASFKTNGMTSYKGNKFPETGHVFFYNINTSNLLYNQDNVDQVNKAIMQTIKGSAKISGCKRLEDLDEGLKLIVCGIKKKVLRNRTRYILQFENIETLYLSNYWLEKEIEELEVDLKYKLKIKLDKIKTTVTKKKERVVFCVY